ncbi:MAG: 3-phosphoshikimate 1-carboxyvinyltransferase [Bacteroidales bacterium]|nr:3-phosphoshikimate 1-carboxyvinyltransferase [Bacteroidales bacterium]
MNIISINKISELPSEIFLPSSKSISNRLLILNALSGNRTDIMNLSNANDTKILKEILEELKNKSEKYIFNVKNAGTTFRFLTAFLAAKEGVFEIQCDERMKKRPVEDLVNALKTLGADIQYLENEGFPPIRIKGKKLKSTKLSINGNISSQFISALLMIGPTLPEGMSLFTDDNENSQSYIKMTLELLKKYGVKYGRLLSSLYTENQELKPPQNITVEADWSAASVWYAFVSLISEAKVKLKDLQKNSIQGDSKLSKIYSQIGVKTTFETDGIIIENSFTQPVDFIELDLIDSPDLTPTIAVNLCLLGIKYKLKGIKNLRFKESNRIEAIISTLSKFGYSVENKTPDTLEWNGEQENVLFSDVLDSYDDHRIAMACSLFSTNQEIKISNPECVEKSYPNFFETLVN